MYRPTTIDSKLVNPFKWIAVTALCACMLSLAGCGSTKVYTADKTIVYKDSIYNVSNVKVFTTKVEAVISDTETVSLKNADKKKIQELLEQNDPLFVRQVVNLDDQELVYQARNVKSWSDYNKMNKQFSNATNNLTKFLADKKKTQLKLK